jgi:hypothetical protein
MQHHDRRVRSNGCGLEDIADQPRFVIFALKMDRLDVRRGRAATEGN